ncbi:MAG: metallophosphoesterase family protein [Armatimonadota bacterium]|nr:metallophosphoesterase family protein [Armatimonadota bacterium]MCX7777130.1 metallophosphoesterase family protein [Armatimonadota bacterium]MDW8025177.1 metallophosphoesterase family protein [Armatimonadota bacterium]
MLRILLVSDMHGDLTHLFSALDAEQPDLLICAGDWGDPKTIPREKYEQLLSMLPVFTVYGNHDDIDLLSQLRNADGTPVLLRNGEVVKSGGITLTGINGIWAKSKRKPFYVLDEEVHMAANMVASYGVDLHVLVTHACPIGIADMTPKGTHGGQRCFLEAFKLIRPKLYACGHLHLPQHRKLKDGTLVINIGYTNLGDYAVVAVGNNECVFEKIVVRSTLQ